jgi:hypothetical protein
MAFSQSVKVILSGMRSISRNGFEAISKIDPASKGRVIPLIRMLTIKHVEPVGPLAGLNRI